MTNKTGHCLCGAVKYELTGEPQMVGICHCKNCQRQAGTAFSIIAGYPANALSVTSGDLAVFEDKADSGNTVLRKFCGRCGSPILSELQGQSETVFIKAGTLDDTSGLVPQFHLWCNSSQKWYEIPEGVATMPQQ